jgi:hypothetical protein
MRFRMHYVIHAAYMVVHTVVHVCLHLPAYDRVESRDTAGVHTIVCGSQSVHRYGVISKLIVLHTKCSALQLLLPLSHPVFLLLSG